MNIYDSSQIKVIENHTIVCKSLNFAQIMFSAGEAFVKSLIRHVQFDSFQKCVIFCGPGNNGGDGLVIAQILSSLHNIPVNICCLDIFENKSNLYVQYLKLISHNKKLHVYSIDNHCLIPKLNESDLLIDAILGIGINRPIDDIISSLIHKINDSNAYVVSVDIPSGMFADNLNRTQDIMVKPQLLITFQYLKPSFVLEENFKILNKCKVADIGLLSDGKGLPPIGYYIDKKHPLINISPRTPDTYKSLLGKSMIIGGALGMYGAPCHSAKAALRIGAGYSLLFTPSDAQHELKYNGDLMIQYSSEREYISEFPMHENNITYGIGPGMGQNKKTKASFIKFLNNCNSPIVLDADALNMLASDQFWNLIPAKSILTPHLGEFRRLAGVGWKNGEEKLEIQKILSNKHNCIIVLKGPITSISTPENEIYFVATGNPALAVAGTGDVLTGMITGLLAQKNQPLEAAIQGAYLHGLAADIYIRDHNERTLTPSILIEYIDFALNESMSSD